MNEIRRALARTPGRQRNGRDDMTIDITTPANELDAHFSDTTDAPCECQHDAPAGTEPCGLTAAARVTTPCSEPGCDRAGCVELLCDSCTAQRIQAFGAARVTIRPL